VPISSAGKIVKVSSHEMFFQNIEWEKKANAFFNF
jgi:hypothetical protein